MSGGVTPSLRAVAEQVPWGFECRSCGASAYNWLCKADRYYTTGEPCCPEFREWMRRAQAGEPTASERKANRDLGRRQADPQP